MYTTKPPHDDGLDVYCLFFMLWPKVAMAKDEILVGLFFFSIGNEFS